MKRWLVLATVLALALGAGVAGTGLAQANPTRLRAVNAIPDGPSVDVLVDNSTVFSNLAFTTVTPYTGATAGSHDIKVVPTGSTTAVIDTTQVLQPNRDHTFIAAGTMSSPTSLLLVDDNTLPSSSQARVRFVHVSPNAPAVDVAVTGNGVLFSNVSFLSVGNYITVNAATVNLEVRQAGTSNVLLSIPNVTLSGSTVFTIFIMGLLNGTPPLQSVISVDATPTAAAAATATAVSTATASPTATPSGTPTATAVTATPTVTATAVTATPSLTATAVTATPSLTATAVTATPSRTATAVTATPTGTAAATATPSTAATVTGTAAASATPTTAAATSTSAAPTATTAATSAVTATSTTGGTAAVTTTP